MSEVPKVSIGKTFRGLLYNKSINYDKMLTNPNFKFSLSVSKKNYPSKPEDEACKNISFKPKTLTVESALEYAVHGKAFCYCFHSTFSDGYLRVKQKTSQNYRSTSTIIYDFDNMDVRMEDYINSLPFEPTFAYTSYSDGVKGRRYRLAYVFDEDIIGEQDFLKMYNAIGNANSFVPETKEHGGVDVRGCSQMYFGTHGKAKTYKSNIIYSPSDFDDYVVPVEQMYVQSNKKEVSVEKYVDTIDEDFLNDMNTLAYGGFFKKYYEQYYKIYQDSLETSLSVSENVMWLEYPEDYVAVVRKRNGKYTLRWEIGEDRKKKLYITAQVMLYNAPEMSLENLIYGLLIERNCYYQNQDNKIDNQVLIQTAINAFNKRISLNQTKHGSFRVNKEFWKEQGVTMNQAKNYIKYQKRVNEILPYIDSKKSIKENHTCLLENGFKISEKTLQRMVAKGDIEIISKLTTDTLLCQCPTDVTIRQNKIIELMKTNDKITADEIAKQLDCDSRTVKRDIKKMKGILIDRVGNNRSGRWIVLCDAKPKQGPKSDSVMDDFDFLEESFEADKTIVDVPQPKSDDELREEMLNDGWTEQEVADFFSIYAVA